MPGFKWKKIVGGLNFQFIAYFLLFAYLPLLAFSIIGYQLNKRLINQIYEHNLQVQVQNTEQNLRNFLDLKKEKIKQLYKMGHLLNGPDHVPELSCILVSHGDEIESYKTSTPLSAMLTDSLRHSKNTLYYEANRAQMFFAVELDSGVVIWASLPESVFRNLLRSDDPHTSLFLRNSKKETPISILGENPAKQVSESPSIFSILRTDRPLLTSVNFLPNWNVVGERSAKGLYVELERFLREIFLGNFIIGMLMFGIAILLAGKITNPIRHLVLAANKFGSGDLSTSVQVKGSEEINILSAEFERMRQKLMESYSNLEEKIEQRTKALQEAQFQISHQEKMASLGLLSAGVAHEIGNPLTGISSMAQIIKRRVKDEAIINYADTILKNIDRISRIVRELVDFTRPSNYKATHVSVNDIIESSVGIARYDKRAKNIDLERNFDTKLPMLFLVEDQLQQVFINILMNAIDACPNENGKLKIHTFSENGKINIHFSDNGIGIQPEHLSKIFEPFFTTKKVGKGTGLGLSVSYGIIHNLNGSISVDSEPGIGSTFKIEIPINQMETINES